MSYRSKLKNSSGSDRSILFFSVPFLFFFEVPLDYKSHLGSCQEKVIHRWAFARFFFAGYTPDMISQRRLKKLRRFMANKIQGEYRDKLKDILKPRPRWIPKFVWKFLINLLLDLPEIK